MGKRTASARIGPLKIAELMPDIQLYFMEGVGDLEIWRVEGEIIRDQIDIDFTEGGNSERYPWIGPKKIWIDLDVDEDRVICVKAHELHELILMSKGWDYDPAHDHSNRTVEQPMRDHLRAGDVGKAEAMWEEQKRLYLEMCGR